MPFSLFAGGGGHLFKYEIEELSIYFNTCL